MSESLPPPIPVPEVFDSHMFPSRRRPFLQFFLDHNPCLLLSTVCMLLGCYLINAAIDPGAADQLKLWALIGVINLYELCIIPLGLVLIRRSHGIARDGLWLLLFETLFLVNGTFINVDPALYGWTSHAVLFAMACVKAAILFRGLGIGLGPRTWGFLCLQLAIIYGLPVFFWQMKVGIAVPPLLMYGLWWLVGLLPVAYDLLARLDNLRDRHFRLDLVQQVIRRTYLIAPWIMLVAHLGFSHWAHRAPFLWANLTPILLGLTIAIGRASPIKERINWRIILPIAAFLIAFTAPSSLTIDIFYQGPPVQPWLLSIAAMAITYGYMRSFWSTISALAAVSLFALYLNFQRSLLALTRWILTNLSAAVNEFTTLLPTTVMAWGVWSVCTAFILLAIGATLSLRRKHPDQLTN